MAVPFGPWRPDVYGLNSEFSSEVNGVLPGSQGWTPFPNYAALSLAVGAEVRGAYVARSSTGSAVIFAFTATAAFKFAGAATAWTDVSNVAAFSLPTGEYWSIDQFDNILIAVQAGDEPQFINIDTGTACADIAGAPKARYCKVVGDFLFLLDLVSVAGGGASTGRIQIAWSGLQDYDFWTYGQKSSDFATFNAGGFPVGMSSPQTGILVQQGAVNRFVRVTDRRTWDFATIEGGQGSKSPYSLIEHQGVLYYYGIDGFVASSAGAFTQESGVEFVDEWWKANVNQSRPGAIIGALDPTRPRLLWLAPSTGNTSNTLDVLVGYDMKLEQWFKVTDQLTLSYLFKVATSATTLENLGSAGLGYTLETVPYSLDSPVWQGGTPQIGGFDANQKLGYFSGSAMAATLRTSLFQPIPGRRFYVNGWRILTDALNVSSRIAVTERPMTSASWGVAVSVNRSGKMNRRASGRFCKIEATIAAGETWDHIQSADFDPGDVQEDGED